MRRFASTFAALAVLTAVAQSAPAYSKDAAAERRIREALDQPTQIEFVETPLKDVIDHLKATHHIEIQLDGPALKDAGVDESCSVTRNLKGISLRSALRLMLDELQLKYVVRNEVLLITSAAKAESDEYTETRVYPVTDLVFQAPDGTADFRPLMDMLTSNVASKTWAENGGNGSQSAIVVGNRPLLVVRQTQEVHEEIEKTLNMLRKAGGLKTAR
jgi:hypothetical protein